MFRILTVITVLLALVGLLGYHSHRSRPANYLADLWARATSLPVPAYLNVDGLLDFHRRTFGTAVAVLWTDVIDPATLTGYARASLEDYETRKGTLARYLPNRTVMGIVARFIKGSTGLLDIARFRAFDAEIEVGKRPAGQRVTLELPALGDQVPVSEYEQLRGNGGTPSDEAILRMIQATTDQQMQKVADAIERMRGVVLNTGIATVAQDNFHTADDFGRSGSHSVVAGSLWSTAAVDRLADLQSWSDTYEDDNGVPPGSILMSRRVFRALAAGHAVRHAARQRCLAAAERAGCPRHPDHARPPRHRRLQPACVGQRDADEGAAGRQPVPAARAGRPQRRARQRARRHVLGSHTQLHGARVGDPRRGPAGHRRRCVAERQAADGHRRHR
jgi:hypothetical protein